MFEILGDPISILFQLTRNHTTTIEAQQWTDCRNPSSSNLIRVTNSIGYLKWCMILILKDYLLDQIGFYEIQFVS